MKSIFLVMSAMLISLISCTQKAELPSPQNELETELVKMGNYIIEQSYDVDGLPHFAKSSEYGEVYTKIRLLHMYPQFIDTVEDLPIWESWLLFSNFECQHFDLWTNNSSNF